MANPDAHESMRHDIDLSEVVGVIFSSGGALGVRDVSLVNAVITDQSTPGNEFKEQGYFVTVHQPNAPGGIGSRAFIKRETVAGFFLA